jgi:hypothetical protein
VRRLAPQRHRAVEQQIEPHRIVTLTIQHSVPGHHGQLEQLADLDPQRLRHLGEEFKSSQLGRDVPQVLRSAGGRRRLPRPVLIPKNLVWDLIKPVSNITTAYN